MSNHNHGDGEIADAPIEAHELRACLRDLVSLLALPVAWGERNPEAVLHALLDVLVGVLRLELAYGCVDVDGERSRFARSVRMAARPSVNGQEVAIAHCLAPLLNGGGSVAPLEVANPLGGEPLRAVRMPLGLTNEGYVIVASCRPSFPTQHDLLLLRVATNQALLGLQEARLLKQRANADDEREQLLRTTQRHVGLLRGLSQASLTINSSASLDEVLRTITDAARELIGAHQSVTSMTTGEDWAQAINTVSLSDKYAAYRIYAEKPNGSGIYSVVCELNKTFRMTQAELEDHPAWRGLGNEKHGHPPMRGWLAVPLIARDGKNIGLVQLSDKYAGEFTEEDETILVQLAQLAAVAIENAEFRRNTEQAREVAEQEARRTAQLLRMTAALAGTTSLSDVGIAASNAHEVLGAAAATVYFARSDGTFQWASHRGLPAEFNQRERLDPQAPLPLATALRTGEPVWITGHQELVAAYPAVALSGVPPKLQQAVAALPLKLHGRVLGGIAFSFSDERRFSAPERDVLLSLAQQCAQAVERANLLEAERAARHELQQTVYYNEIFAGILAHDLRNPLGAILNAAQLLQQRQEGSGDRVTKPLSRIVSSGGRMARMIEQLLDFTRIRVGGSIRIVSQETDLGELCRQVIGELEDTNPEWTMNVETSGNMVGQWDPDRLQQVVSNLAANAVQHGQPDAGLHLRLVASADEIELRVQNKGAMQAELLPSLFDPFRGTQQHRAHGHGLGLGLFITKEIVVAHGGSVTVESSEDAGTIFIVRLPRHRGQAKSQGPLTPEASPRSAMRSPVVEAESR